jgi:hypothetical protein
MRSPDDDDDGEHALPEEQDLLVVLRLGNQQMGTQQERRQIEAFADQLGEAVAAAGVGEYDGDEIGGGEYTLFFCGPDVDQLLAVLRPLLVRSPFGRGAHFVRTVTTADGHATIQRLPV